MQTRRSFLLRSSAVMAAGLASPSIGKAQTRSLVVAGWGSNYEASLRGRLIPAFEKEHNCRVSWVAGSSFDNIGRVRAQKANPQIDVCLIDDWSQLVGRQEGLFTHLDPSVVKELANVVDLARMPENLGTGFSMSTVGIVYNEKIFSEKNLPAPKSWTDLARPDFKDRIVMRPLSSGYTLTLLVALARINGGGERDIDPGFKAFAGLRGNILEFPPSAGAMTTLLLKGDAWLGVIGNSEASELIRRKAPVKYIIPDEGTHPTMETINIIKGGPNPELAQLFVNEVLKPEGQADWTRGTASQPVNRRVNLADLKEHIPYDTTKPIKPLNIDMAFVAAQRPAWVDRFNREIATR